MRRKEHQSGFSTTLVLLLALVVTALIATSLVIYQHHKSNSTRSNAATTSSQSANPPQNSTTTQPAQTTTQYLTITQWGVKIPLSSNINDAYYTPSTSSSTGTDKQPNTMLVGVKSLDSNGCNATNTTTTGLIFRALPTDTDSATGKLYTKEYPNGVTVDNYFYAYQSVKSTTCTASPTTIQSNNSAFDSAVKGMVSTTATTN